MAHPEGTLPASKSTAPKRHHCLMGVALLTAGLILFYQLALPPVVGLANNGDFVKMEVRSNLSYAPPHNESKYFLKFFNRYYARQTYPWEGPRTDYAAWFSSELLIIQGTLLIDSIFNKTAVFDVVLLGLIHGALLLVGLGLVLYHLRWLPLPVYGLTCALLVFMFTDVGYVAYFNTLYTEPAVMLFGLIWVGLCLGFIAGKAHPWWLLAYFANAVLFLTARYQMSVMYPIVIGYGLVMAWRLYSRRWLVVALGASLLVAAACGLHYATWPKTVYRDNLYLALFRGLLLVSSQPEADLADFNLPPEYVKYVDMGYWSPDSPRLDTVFHEQFDKNVTPLKVLWFYARNPGYLIATGNRLREVVFDLRWEPQGNFEESARIGPYAQSRAFDLWSNFRRHVLPGYTYFVIGFLAFLGALAVIGYVRVPAQRRYMELWLVLIGFAGVQYILLLQAAQESRHFFTFNVIFDLCLVPLIIGFMRWVWQGMSRRAGT